MSEFEKLSVPTQTRSNPVLEKSPAFAKIKQWTRKAYLAKAICTNDEEQRGPRNAACGCQVAETDAVRTATAARP